MRISDISTVAFGLGTVLAARRGHPAGCSRRVSRALVYSRHLKVSNCFIFIMKQTLQVRLYECWSLLERESWLRNILLSVGKYLIIQHGVLCGSTYSYVPKYFLTKELTIYKERTNKSIFVLFSANISPSSGNQGAFTLTLL